MLGLPKCCDRLGITSCTYSGQVKVPCQSSRICHVSPKEGCSDTWSTKCSTYLVLGEEAMADARHSHEYHLGHQRLVLQTAVSKAHENEELLTDAPRVATEWGLHTLTKTHLGLTPSASTQSTRPCISCRETVS